MVRPIVKDIIFLGRRSEPATKADMQMITDLKDTLAANHDRCVGMAANMIGFNKRIIIFSTVLFDVVMINPIIVRKKGEYETEEGCLSLEGERKTKRYKEIEVEYLDCDFKKKRGVYKDFTAQIIQHECDHLEGIII